MGGVGGGGWGGWGVGGGGGGGGGTVTNYLASAACQPMCSSTTQCKIEVKAG